MEQEIPVKVASGQTLSLPTILLKSKAQRLDGVEVTGEGSLVPTKETEYVARMPLANIENPQVYNVVSSKLMEKQGVVDFKNAITNVAGASIATQLTTSQNFLTIRGFFSRSNVRNGLMVNQFTATEVANIERIEVIKGPTGTLFGGALGSSYGGLVNRVTKKPFENFVTNVTYTTGRWGFNRLTADVNTPLTKDHTVLLRNNIALETTDTWQDAGGGNTVFYAPSLVYKANDRLTLSLDADVYQYKGAIPSPISLSDNIPGVKSFKDLKLDPKINMGSDQMYSDNFAVNVFTKAEYQLSPNWKSTTLVNYGRHLVKMLESGARIVSFNLADIRLLTWNRNTTEQQVQQNFNGKFKLLGMRHRVLVGLDYYSQKGIGNFAHPGNFTSLAFREKKFSLSRQSAEAFIAKVKPRIIQDKSQTYSAYLSDVIDFTDRLHLLLSLRLDRFDNIGRLNYVTGKTSGVYQQTALAPRLGVVYELLPKQLSLFANYNRGFTNRPGTDVKGNAFVPEKANQMEGGLKWEPKSKVANITLSYYHIEVEDMVRPDVNNPNFSIQDGNIRSSGFELDAALNPVEGLSIIAGYAYNDAKIIKGRNPKLNGNRPGWGNPEHLVNFFANYNFSGALKGLDIGFGGNAGSEDLMWDENKLKIEAYTLLNANLGYSVGKVRFNLRAENLTSEVYFARFGQAYAPLRVLGSVSMRF